MLILVFNIIPYYTHACKGFRVCFDVYLRENNACSPDVHILHLSEKYDIIIVNYCAVLRTNERKVFFAMFEDLFKKAAHKYSLDIGGMKCEHCAAKVAELLKKIPGIEKVVPSVAEGRIDIVSSVPVVKELVEKAVKEAGFDFKGFTEKK